MTDKCWITPDCPGHIQHTLTASICHECGMVSDIFGERPIDPVHDFGESSRSPGRLTADVDVIRRLRGQLQNCVNHLELAKRKGYGGHFDEAIESANRALYETLSR